LATELAAEWRGLQLQGQAIPKLESNHEAVLESRQFIEKLTELPLEFDYFVARNLDPAPVAIQPRNPHKPSSATEKGLSRLDTHVFKAAALLIAHDLC
jgi:hypothetical protein